MCSLSMSLEQIDSSNPLTSLPSLPRAPHPQGDPPRDVTAMLKMDKEAEADAQRRYRASALAAAIAADTAANATKIVTAASASAAASQCGAKWPPQGESKGESKDDGKAHSSFSSSSSPPSSSGPDPRSFRLAPQFESLVRDFVRDNWAPGNLTKAGPLAVLLPPKSDAAMEEADATATARCNHASNVSATMGGVARWVGGLLIRRPPKPCRMNTKIAALDAAGKHSSLLAGLLAYMDARVPKLSEYCIICDATFLFPSGSATITNAPSVCERDLCVWSYRELGVMAACTDMCNAQAEVVDVLVAMTAIAANSHRARTILKPFPPHAHFASTAAESPHVEVNRVARCLPSMQDMVTSADGNELAAMCARNDKMALPLLQWIISSNKSRIVSLPLSARLGSMGTPHQFVLASQSPKEEAAFNKLRKMHGSQFVR